MDQIDAPAQQAGDKSSGFETDATAPATSGRGEGVRLTPDSAIQFLDFRVPDSIATAVRRRFFEEHGAPEAGLGAALHSVALEDGILYHPVTGEPCDAALTYAIDGAAAFAAFAGSWMPLPILRVIGRDARGAATLDTGPTNWARAHIVQVAGTAGYRVTLALDTRIGRRRRDAGGIAAPADSDVTGATRFCFASDESAVAEFVNEAWIDDWISEAFQRSRSVAATDAAALDPPGRVLEHLAHYLALLTTLAAARVLPEFDFTGAAPSSGSDGHTDVHLVLDIGHRRTCALLHEPAGGTHEMTHLPIRDLGHPWRVHRGIFASTLAFAKPAFGSEALSRWSGRTDAFYWPSLARVGVEADRLMDAQATADGPSGLAGVPAALWDDRPVDQVWRFCASTGQRGPMLSGPQLGCVSETGALLDPGAARGATTKPRFAPSCMLAFFAAELIVQAHAAINAPAYRAIRSGPGRPRRLAKIVLAPSARMHAEERARLVAALQTALGLVWPSLAAHDGGPALSQAPPAIEIVADTGVCQQIAYLESEVATRFAGATGDYFELVGRRRPSFKSGKSVRIATFDIGHSSSSLAVATFAPDGAQSMSASRQISDALGTGGRDIARAIVAGHIAPALAGRLAEGRLGNAAAFVAGLLDGSNARHPAFGQRFASAFADPIALAMLGEQVTAPTQPQDGLVERTLRHYFTQAPGASVAVVEEFDDIAADEGAVGFAPLDTPISFFPRDIADTVADVLRPALDAIIRVVAALDCDIVLLSGLAARIPAVAETMRAAVLVRPDRIICLDSLRVGAWYAVADASARIGDSKSAAVVGAALLASGPAATLPVTFIGADAEDARLFIGTFDSNGCVPAGSVLFGAPKSAAAPARGADASQPRSAAAPAPGEQVAVLTTVLPRQLGARRLPVGAWPAVALYRIEIEGAAALPRLKGPFKLTLAHSEDRIGEAGTLRVLRASDVAGNTLDPATIRLRLCTQSGPAP